MASGCAAGTLSRQDFDAVLFDLDGVITQTAKVHAAAWKHMFDAYLKQRAEHTGEPYRPFDIDRDYRQYVDGKPRFDGVASFLESRGIHLPHGSVNDPPEAETVTGLGNRKNAFFLKTLQEQGPEVYPSTITLIRQLRAHGFRIAVVSASTNCQAILDTAHIADLFDTRVDGITLAEKHLRGKPEPDSFLEAARELHTEAARAVVVEDAISGVEAGVRGKFGCVIGVDRTGHPDALKAAGATLVVQDLGQVSVAG
jgi:beta-phosphoglucomutase family hydrolase